MARHNYQASDSSIGLAPLQAGIAAAGFKIASVNLETLCVSMSSSNGGVQICDRVFRLSRYAECFVGSEAIDWLCAEMGIARDQALKLGQRLISHGMVKHVLDEHDFEDAYVFYRFVQSERGVDASAIEDSAMAAIDMTQLAWDVRSASGVRVAAQHHRFVRYPDCFIGSELISWICLRHHVTRPTALKIGRLLLRRNVIRHVFDEHDLEDARLFYRFV